MGYYGMEGIMGWMGGIMGCGIWGFMGCRGEWGLSGGAFRGGVGAMGGCGVGWRYGATTATTATVGSVGRAGHYGMYVGMGGSQGWGAKGWNWGWRGGGEL